MLFDLTSPRRKRVLRVVYGFLAVVFAAGFIGFGIGTESGVGGLFDTFGGGGSSTADQYKDQIEQAEDQLEENPENANALLVLARYRYLSGAAQLEVDEATGFTVLTEDARGEFEEAIEAWNGYLDTDPRKPDVATAGNIVQAYAAFEDFEGAAEAQAILADANPSAGTYLSLAAYRFAELNFKGAEKAGEQALAEATRDEREQVQSQLKRWSKQARQYEKQLENLPAGEAPEEALRNPFGGLGPAGGAGGLPPTTP